jgi:hypothetical protein
MRNAPSNPRRRRFILRSVGWTSLAALTAAAMHGRSAEAKAAKSDFRYQDHGHDGKSCGQCRFFSAATPSASVGSCAVVAGEISRNGWCAAFTAKVPA